MKPYEKFAEMIERHRDGLAAYCKLDNKAPLGLVESLHNKIRVIHPRAYGQRDEGYLRLKLLTCMLPALKYVPKSSTRFPQGTVFYRHLAGYKTAVSRYYIRTVLWVRRNGNAVVYATKADHVSDDFVGPFEMEKLSSTRPYLLRAFYA
ncbi:MAG: transposase, partial [Gammaproteobacteria bacterium]